MDKPACDTLRLNRPQWNVVEQDLNNFDASGLAGVDIVAGGLPCPVLAPRGRRIMVDLLPDCIYFS
jgi:DNA (cytosine-5)-methyltransferase 1